jgi:hypothetical protein
MRHAIVIVASLCCALPVWEGVADVVGVKVRHHAAGSYDFAVTVRGADKGWESYADAFEVLGPGGTLVARRDLLHPHETEQPFARYLYGVKVPPGVAEVTVRAHYKPKGYDGKAAAVRLPR